MLSGVNKKCKMCEGKCKQFEQVTVAYCPNYVDKYHGKDQS